VSEWLKRFPKQPALRWTIAGVWLLFLGWIAFLWNLGNIGLVDETEPLFAEAARQMTVTGDWITPYFNESTRFDKPPLVYWLMAIGYKLIGVNEWAVRLPSALSAIALMGLVFYTLRYFSVPPIQTRHDDVPTTAPETPPQVFQFKPWLTAGLGAAMVALNPEMIAWGRVGVSDMLLTGCMDAALLCFFIGYSLSEKLENVNHNNTKSRAFPWYIAFYILIALAVLTKGPVAIVLPALIISAFLLYVGKFREVLQEMHLIPGILLLLAIAVPWYILVILANGENYINSFFGYHNLERFTSVVNRHWAPWYFYFVVVFVGFAPWSIYLPIAMTRLQFWKRTIWSRQPRSSHLGLFAFFWFTCIFLFFTIAVTKLPSYVLPLMPAAAILVALLWSDIILPVTHAGVEQQAFQHQKPANSIFLQLTTWGNFLLFLLGTSAFISSSLWLKKIKDPTIPDLPKVIQDSGILGSSGLVFSTTAILMLFFLLRHQIRWLWIVNFFGFLMLFVVAVTPALFLMDHHRQMPLRELAKTIIQERQPGEQVVMIGFEKPSLVFYSQRRVIFYRRTAAGIEYVRNKAAQPPNPPSALMIGYPSKFEDEGLTPKDYQLLDKAGAYQLIRLKNQVVAKGRSDS
jgi:4-amino-4-deoxy-L-arabinose transferase-like glycosyltransferase